MSENNYKEINNNRTAKKLSLGFFKNCFLFNRYSLKISIGKEVPIKLLYIL